MSKSWFNKMLQINEENKHLKEHIAELKAQIKYLMEDCRVFNINELKEHNLYMQAKGLEDLAESMLFRGLENTIDRSEVLERAEQLYTQARGE